MKVRWTICYSRDVINSAFFCGDYANELDANFISQYNTKKDEFDYFIQRLAGYAIEKEDNPFEGKIWVPYINKIKQSWSYLCSNNRILKKGDIIEFKYERFEES